MVVAAGIPVVLYCELLIPVNPPPTTVVVGTTPVVTTPVGTTPVVLTPVLT